MNICIRSHEAAALWVRKEPRTYDVVFITSPREPFLVPGSEDILPQARTSIMLQFDDVDGPMPGYEPPTREHVAAILDWSKDKSNFLVSCHAGISRSSATAVVLMASRGTITDALTVLQPQVHHPNPLIVQFGEDILGKPGLADLVREWKRFRGAGTRGIWEQPE